MSFCMYCFDFCCTISSECFGRMQQLVRDAADVGSRRRQRRFTRGKQSGGAAPRPFDESSQKRSWRPEVEQPAGWSARPSTLPVIAWILTKWPRWRKWSTKLGKQTIPNWTWSTGASPQSKRSRGSVSSRSRQGGTLFWPPFPNLARPSYF